MTMPAKNVTLIRLLPLLHAFACAALLGPWPDLGALFMIIDFPASILILTFAWRYDVQLVFVFGVFGTLWWFLLSLVILRLKLRESKSAKLRSGKPAV
jgi:hypothetical protein